jgi:hypothetical protein
MTIKTQTLKRDWLRIVSAGLGFNVRVQKWLVSAGNHYVQHGDTSLLGWAMENSWNSGFKRDAMIKWIGKHLKVSINETGKGKVVCEITDKDRTKIDMGVAAGDLFYLDRDRADAKDAADYDLDKSAKSFVARAIKADVAELDVITAITKQYLAQAVKKADAEKPLFDQVDRKVVALG